MRKRKILKTTECPECKGVAKKISFVERMWRSSNEFEKIQYKYTYRCTNCKYEFQYMEV